MVGFKIIPVRNPNPEGLVFLVCTYVCVQRGHASLALLRSARLARMCMVEFMFVLMSVCRGRRLARLASLGSLGAREHCGVHVRIHVRTRVCVQGVTF